MGMTIDTAIKNGIDLIDVFKEYFASDKAIDTISELVEIAKKYRKIEEIALHYGFETSWLCMRKIKEVLGDGEEKIQDKN